MFRDYINRHIQWSVSTFGKGRRTEGLCKHITKELEEIRQSPDDLMEWIDVIILALDGAWRTGHNTLEIINALIQKQAINFDRKWTRANEDEPTEHERCGNDL